MLKDNNTEQLIVEVAEKLFLEKGFAMTSTTEIAREVGCNQAMVHYYYRTKEKLFEAIFEKKVKLFVGALLQIGDENISFEEKLKMKIEAHFDLISQNPRIPFLFFNELTTNPQRLESIKNKIGEYPKAILAELSRELKLEIQKGNVRQIEPIDLLMTIISLNIVMFLVKPIVQSFISISDEEYKKLIERRKKENVHLILSSLKP